MKISNLYFDGCKVKSSSILLDGENMRISVINCDLAGIINFLMGNLDSGESFSIGIDTDNGYYESICYVGVINEKDKSFYLCLSGKIIKGNK